MKWWPWIESSAIYLVIVAALAAGLAASYGRELEAQRRPDRGWWVRRLLIMPLLAIAATAATEWLGLRPSVSAFTAAMLSLGGYDALCFIETRWLRRLKRLAEASQSTSGVLERRRTDYRSDRSRCLPGATDEDTPQATDGFPRP